VYYLVCHFVAYSRFTTELASTAKSVVAVDFMEKFINKNREDNGHFKNIDFRCMDVTKLNLQSNRYEKSLCYFQIIVE